jgi:hypothetical protein
VGDLDLRFDRSTGELAGLSLGLRAYPLSHGPRVVAYRRDGKNFTDVSGPSTLTSFHLGISHGMGVAKATYSGALRDATWHVLPSGQVWLDYDVAFDGPVDILGVAFDYPEKQVLSKRWLGGGPYHVWRNRLKGTVLDVWQTPYNDTVPGDTWIYPEFKGFFSDWRWFKFRTAEGGRLTFYDEDSPHDPFGMKPVSYFGVFKPNDGRVGPILVLPPLGLGVYRVIPAMGSKTSTPDLMGPHSQTEVRSGTYHGTFRFEVGE